MEIPAGSADTYCLAQSDDYISFSRGQFQHAPPWTLSLNARVSAPDLPGTWGFGLWNDPFGFSLGFGGTARRLPALPNTAWFFHASPPNWLSLHNAIPGRGFFAGAIKAPRIPSILLAPAILALPLVAIRPVSRLLRRLAGRMIEQDACLIPVDVTNWHKYSIEWLHEYVEFNIDDQPVLRTSLSPPPPLGLVIWIDNQYAFWDPTGRLGYGTLGNPAAWLEVTDIQAG
jgi:hypothetical protein